jgi:regulator of PEP synthase PpsR (kinase-PPPase family)
MNKVSLALKSKTFWTIVIAIVVNTINANQQFIPMNVLDIVNPILGLMATYFHVNPSQNYYK